MSDFKNSKDSRSFKHPLNLTKLIYFTSREINSITKYKRARHSCSFRSIRNFFNRTQIYTIKYRLYTRNRLSKSEQLPPNYYISNNSNRTISHRVAGSTSATPPFSGKMEGKHRVWSSCTCLPEGGEVSVGRTTARNVTWPSGSFDFSGCYYRRHFSRLRKRVFRMGEPWKIFDRCNWIEIVLFWLGGNSTRITTHMPFSKFYGIRDVQGCNVSRKWIWKKYKEGKSFFLYLKYLCI